MVPFTPVYHFLCRELNAEAVEKTRGFSQSHRDWEEAQRTTSLFVLRLSGNFAPLRETLLFFAHLLRADGFEDRN